MKVKLFALIFFCFLKLHSQEKVYSTKISFKGSQKEIQFYESNNQKILVRATSKKELNFLILDSNFQELTRIENYGNENLRTLGNEIGHYEQDGKHCIKFLNTSTRTLKTIEFNTVRNEVSLDSIPSFFDKNLKLLSYYQTNNIIHLVFLKEFHESLVVFSLGPEKTLKNSFDLSSIPEYYDIISQQKRLYVSYNSYRDQAGLSKNDRLLNSVSQVKLYPLTEFKLRVSIDQNSTTFKQYDLENLSNIWETASPKKIKTEPSTYVIDLDLANQGFKLERFAHKMKKRQKLLSNSFLLDSCLFQMVMYRNESLINIKSTNIKSKKETQNQWISSGATNYFSDIPVQKWVLNQYSPKSFKDDKSNSALFSGGKPIITANEIDEEVIRLEYGIAQVPPQAGGVTTMGTGGTMVFLPTHYYTSAFSIKAYAEVDLKKADQSKVGQRATLDTRESEAKNALYDKIDKIDEELNGETATKQVRLLGNEFYCYYLPFSRQLELVKL